MPLKKILVIGAAGNLGTLVLNYLHASPAKFEISVLTRSSSSSTFPSSVNVLRVPDDYPHDALIKAFTGMDVVISTISMMGMHQQYKFIDAAVAAKVQRYIPTEFGLDDLPDWLVEIRPMFRTKHDVRDYLGGKEKDGLTWTAIVCNVFFEMGVTSGFFGFDWKSKKVTLIDQGEQKWVATTLDTVALAIVRVLEPQREAETSNKLLLIQDFRTSQAELLQAIEQKTGKWTVEDVKYDSWLEEAKTQVQNGDNSALSKLTFATVVTGSDWENRKEFANKLLDLPAKTFQDAIAPVFRNHELA